MPEINVSLKDKISAGLAACLPRTKAEAQTGCRECPYRGGACEECVEMPVEIAEDMRALLKALEPRLMTPEEAFRIAPGKSCIVESNSPLDGMRIIRNGLFLNLRPNGVCEFEFPYSKGELPTVEYGKTWRCWTSEPTYEQMKATGWTHVT